MTDLSNKVTSFTAMSKQLTTVNTKLLSVDERIDSVENKVNYINMEELKTKRRIHSPKIAVRIKMKAPFILLTWMSVPIFLFCALFVGKHIREMGMFFSD